MAETRNPAPSATGDGSGLDTDVEQQVYARPRLEAQVPVQPEFNEPNLLRSPRRERLGPAAIIVRLMHECDGLRDENAQLRIALRGFDAEPQSPFSLLSGAEIINILHPEGGAPSADKRRDGIAARRAVARVTHQMARRARPAAEIRAAVLAEAKRGGLSSEHALAISSSIIRDVVAEGHHA